MWKLPPANGGDNSNPGNGDNNNKPGEDNNNSNPGNGDNNNKPGEDNNNSNPGNGDNSNTGGEDNNNQQPLPPIDEPIYIDVNSRYEIEDHIISDVYIISALIKQVIPSFNNKIFSFEWWDVPQLAYDNNMKITYDGTYTYYNVKSIKFTFSNLEKILEYIYLDDNGNKMPAAYISGIQSVTVSVDIHFRSTTDFIGGSLGR